MVPTAYACRDRSPAEIVTEYLLEPDALDDGISMPEMMMSRVSGDTLAVTEDV